MRNYFQNRAKEPTTKAGAILLVVTAVVHLLVTFGVVMTPAQQQAIFGLANVLVIAWFIFKPEKKMIPVPAPTPVPGPLNTDKIVNRPIARKSQRKRPVAKKREVKK